MGNIQIKRGLAENLPSEALLGEILYTTDTKKFYIGNGEGIALTEFNNATQLTNFLANKANKSHTHSSNEITDFATSVDSRITIQKGVANGIATLDVNGKIPTTQIPTTFKEASVVDTISERDALTPFSGMHALVIDASADSTVESGGGAEYVYNGTKWIKISEFNSLDTLVDWTNVQNKPEFVSSTLDLEDMPATLEGCANMILCVKPDETGYTFTAPSSGDIDGGSF